MSVREIYEIQRGISDIRGHWIEFWSLRSTKCAKEICENLKSSG